MKKLREVWDQLTGHNEVSKEEIPEREFSEKTRNALVLSDAANNKLDRMLMEVGHKS